MDKNQLRKQIIARRNNLDYKYISEASSAIYKNVLDCSKFHAAKVVFSYMPFGNEVNIMPLNQWILDNGKALCIPRVKNASEMDAVAVESLSERLTRTNFGILEPDKSINAINIEKIDLILVPGVAFDNKGNRLGYGRGYYDRFLGLCHTHTEFWGIAYSFQVLDSIPSTSYDVKVHKIITEQGQIIH